LLSNFGDITDESVAKHFNLSLNTDVINLIKVLKDNLGEALKRTDAISSRNDIVRIYESLIKNTIGICKLKYGVNEFKNIEQKNLAQEVTSILTQDDLNNLLEELLKRNKYVDKLTLESDIILLNYKLNTSFAKKVVEVPHTIIEKSIAVKETKVCSMEDESLNEEAIESENSDLDGTVVTTNRYKSYPPQLAMMFEKSKKQSSVKSDKSVELNQEVKDFKGSVSKSDIRNYLMSKKT